MHNVCRYLFTQKLNPGVIGRSGVLYLIGEQTLELTMTMENQ